MKKSIKVCWITAVLSGALPCTTQAQDLSLGQAVYADNCAACHQASGQGIPGAFPALKASPLVLGDSAELLRVVLEGRGGMPTFNASLSDAQIAAVVTYIRKQWGNQASPVTATQAGQISRSITAVADDGGRGN